MNSNTVNDLQNDIDTLAQAQNLIAEAFGMIDTISQLSDLSSTGDRIINDIDDRIADLHNDLYLAEEAEVTAFAIEKYGDEATATITPYREFYLAVLVAEETAEVLRQDIKTTAIEIAMMRKW